MRKKHENSINDQLSRYVFSFIFTLTLLQMMPVIKDTYYMEIRTFIYGVFIIFGSIKMLSVRNKYKNNFNLYFLLVVVYTVILTSILFLSGERYDYMELLLPFIIYMTSFGTKFNEDQLNKLLKWYVLLSLVMGISSIIYYGEGFEITEQYFLTSKNQIGPIIGYAAFTSWYLSKKYNRDKLMSKLTLLMATLLLMIVLSVIRNRTGLVMLLLMFFIILLKNVGFKRTKKQYIILATIITSFLLLFLTGAHTVLIEFLNKSLFLNYEMNDLNSISAGRTDVYIKAVFFIKEYPILGMLGKEITFLGIPHNYLLKKWINYGLILTIPIVLFYIYLWKEAIKKVLKKDGQIIILSHWLLLYSLLISILEYTYPYSPGTSQLLIWFLLGQHYNRDITLNHENSNN